MFKEIEEKDSKGIVNLAIAAIAGGSVVGYIAWKNVPSVRRFTEIHISEMVFKPEHYNIPHTPVDVDEKGEQWIVAENPVEVKR